jgi:predicted flap endonuclease-1-like 5' DNA nuclease
MAETKPGGVYLVGKTLVNAEGKPVKGEEAESRAGSVGAQPGGGKVEGESASAMPYADLLIPRHFADEDAVDAASDADLIAIDGIGPKRLAEIREYFGQ